MPMPPAPEGSSDTFELNRAIAYRGAIGAKRAAFCQAYLEKKKAVFADIRASQAEAVARAGQTISCHRGCAICCLAYMQANVAECEAIVYYLYQHEEVLQHFLQSFPAWRETLRRHGDIFQECTARWEEKSASENESARQAMQAAEKRYQEQGVYCPFLIDNACAIYEVRPFTCAALIATTPPACCHPASPQPAQPYVTSTPAMFESSFYYGHIEGAILAFMPLVVYGILRDGYHLLAQIPGLEGLAEAALDDPEVKAILAQHDLPADGGKTPLVG